MMSAAFLKEFGMSNMDRTVLDAYLTYEASLRRFIYRYTHQLESVEDILQETFLRAYRVELKRPIEQPKAFLFRIAKHLSISYRQYLGRWTMDECDLETAVFEDYSVEDIVSADQTISNRFSAVADMTPHQRRIYLLRRCEGLTQAQTAARLGIAVHTVEAHMHRASARIKMVSA